jgi:DNA-binding MarR family transcriptional regulator
MNNKQAPRESAPEATAAIEVPWDLPRFRNWIAVGKVNQLAKKALTDRLAEVGLELPHYDVLANVFHYPGLTQQELADKLLVGRSNLSMLLPELERRGLVRRESDEADRRLRRLSLTPEGEALARAGLKAHTALIEHMMGALTDQECHLVGEFMRRVGHRLME